MGSQAARVDFKRKVALHSPAEGGGVKTPVDNRYMARLYIQQARLTRFADWRAKLIQMAVRNRTVGRVKAGQLDLFV